MTTELTLLTWSTALAFMQMCSTAGFLTLTYGIPVSLGNRMELPPHKGALLRSTRALQNMVESLVIFAAAILLAHAAGREDGLTTLGAQIFFWCRLAYWPTYLAGIPYLRTIIWTGAITGIALVLARLL
jgi:uncharacterized MAPEG superfamily protein